MIVLFDREKTDKDKRIQCSLYIQIIDSCRTDVDCSRDMQLFIASQHSYTRINEFEGQTNFLLYDFKKKKEVSEYHSCLP